MIHAIQSLPTYVEGKSTRLEAKVGNVDELLEVGWISAWREATGFYRFSRAHSGRFQFLMVERDAGTWYWVVAEIKGDISELPLWRVMKLGVAIRPTLE